MSLFIPPAVNYQNPLVSIGARWASQPREGPRFVACEIDWGFMGGAQKCVNINLQNNANLEFSQICALKVDNSGCGKATIFIFPDTSDTVTIPAFAPAVIIPVFTNGQQLFVYTPGAEAEDITRFLIHNSIPPPVAIPVSEQSNRQTAAVNNIDPNTNGPTNIISPAISGTLEGFIILPAVSATDLESFAITLEDGVGNVYTSQTITLDNTTYNIPTQLSPIAIPFTNGIKAVVSGSTGSMTGVVSVTLAYAVPQ